MSNQTVGITNEYETWLNRTWRPAVAWCYVAICLMDFIVAPIVTFYFFGRFGFAQYAQWQPLTLQGAGTLHIAMGAIIGVTAWQRGEEKKQLYRTYTPMSRPTSYNDLEQYDQADYRDQLTRDKY